MRPTHWPSGRVFANGLGDWSSISGEVIPKTQKNGTCLTLSIIKYILRVKWSNPGKGVVLSLTLQCSSYWKGSFWIALNYGRQLYLLTREIVQSSEGIRLYWLSHLQCKVEVLLQGRNFHDQAHPIIYCVMLEVGNICTLISTLILNRSVDPCINIYYR